MIRSLRQLLLATSFLALLCVASSALAQDAVPREILITYRCRPADRPAFRQFLATEQSRVLAEQQSQGFLRGYQLLFNPVVTETFDALIILHLTDARALEHWLAFERTSPGGLSPAGLRLASPLMTYFADLPWHGQSPTPASGHSIYYAIPYEYNALDQYKSYVDGYVIPQVQGWMREGVLTSYALYLNRYNVGPPWDSLFLYEYRDLNALGDREKTIAKVRDTLRSDPTWKHWSDIKATLRTESENTMLEEITPIRSTAPRAPRVPSAEPR